jgi:hypothetical protein
VQTSIGRLSKVCDGPMKMAHCHTKIIIIIIIIINKTLGCTHHQLIEPTIGTHTLKVVTKSKSLVPIILNHLNFQEQVNPSFKWGQWWTFDPNLQFAFPNNSTPKQLRNGTWEN